VSSASPDIAPATTRAGPFDSAVITKLRPPVIAFAVAAKRDQIAAVGSAAGATISCWV